MYGCANGYMVYGWCEYSDDDVIDDQWVYYNDIRLFCSYQVKNYAGGNAIYGLTCEIDVNTGFPNIDETEKQKVQKAYTNFVNFYKENDGEEAEIPILGYYIAIDGDMEWEPYSTIFIPYDKSETNMTVESDEEDSSEEDSSEEDSSEEDSSEEESSEEESSEEESSEEESSEEERSDI
jgi:hypothetical protein